MKLLILLGALLAALPASAQTRLDDIHARGVLRVGSTGDYKPFSYRTGAEFIGLDVELAGELAQAMGVKLVIVPTSWPTLMSDFNAGQFDIALSGVSVTAERQKQAYFSVSYLRDGKTPITRCGNEARFQTLEQINQPGVRLIVNPGGTNERFARSYAPQAQLTVYPDNVSIFGQIVAGAADLMITDAIETRLQQRLHPQLCAVHPERPFDSAEKAILLPRDDAFKAYVDQWLGQRLANGSVRKQLERWLAFAWNLEPLRQAIDQRLLLAPAVARAKWNVQAPIEDLPREAQVIAAAVQQGRALGLEDAWVEAVFKAQIEASKTIQRELYAQWRREQAGHFSDAPDLAKTIRPELDRITTQLLRALADNQAVLKSAANNMRPLEAAALSATAAAQALAPF
ncbi:chorismate mutase, putative [Duganella sp. CF402]|uniref:gamma subclass chorismate mutase AroQ n=1 Tax=unclassified Duganella TaxID=2636909 RepID=UPI0008C547DB|nr:MULTISPECIES: gamma subclass chorismate mutase AroQ [unclassified Duganella]RZT11136.1 chorismate mutase-like protein [Duganella sp. BK701]SEK79738.1 chorismate mutase, putative [Duganella sp. CF402]